MSGMFVAYTNRDGSKYYPAVIIADATACCSQGIEFVRSGDFSYPADYPELGAQITVTGSTSSISFVSPATAATAIAPKATPKTASESLLIAFSPYFVLSNVTSVEPLETYHPMFLDNIHKHRPLVSLNILPMSLGMLLRFLQYDFANHQQSLKF